MLACYVVFQNHLPMVADYPSAYRGHPALPLLVSIPTTWDDTRCLSGAVGEHVVIARRAGEQWWVGAMTDRRARDVSIPLDFLGGGRYRALVHRDDLATPSRLSVQERDVTAADTILASLAPAGGALVHLVPAGARPSP
jgi:alpha-glucosidase